MNKADFVTSELSSCLLGKNVSDILSCLEKENVSLKEENLLFKEERLLFKKKTEALEEKVAYFEKEQEKLLGYIRQLKQSNYGRKADAVSDENVSLLPGFEDLFDELFEEETEEREEKQEAEGLKKAVGITKKKGRVALPTNLPRYREVHDLSAEEKICACGCELHKIGEEVSERLDYVPAQARVIEIVRLKYACKGCEEGVKIPSVPAQAIPKGIPTAGLLAHILTSKYVDHLPLYRQSGMLQRIGVDISRGTMSGWVVKCGELLSPLRDLLKEYITSDTYVRADETPVQVLQEPNRKDTTKSYMWVYLTGSHKNIGVVYEYKETRSREGPEGFLKEFQGYLQTDGYGGYKGIVGRLGNTAVGCWAHARRKYVAVVKMFPQKPGKAAEIVGVIQGLYKIEEEIREQSLHPEGVRKIRQEKAKPILETLKKQLQGLKLMVPPKNPLGQAIGYTLNNWEALTAYLEDGRLDIDNNVAERAIRPFAIGRKNWLFMGNPQGAKAASIIYSLIETAKANGLEPYKYLRHVLETIPSLQADKFTSLLPWNVHLPVEGRASGMEKH